MFQIIAVICVIAALTILYIKTRFPPEISDFAILTEKSGLVDNDFLAENQT